GTDVGAITGRGIDYDGIIIDAGLAPLIGALGVARAFVYRGTAGQRHHRPGGAAVVLQRAKLRVHVNLVARHHEITAAIIAAEIETHGGDGAGTELDRYSPSGSLEDSIADLQLPGTVEDLPGQVVAEGAADYKTRGGTLNEDAASRVVIECAFGGRRRCKS